VDKLSWRRKACAVFLFGAATAIPSYAQTFTTLASFAGLNGRQPSPASLTQAADGNLYGTTWLGGANGTGTVFRVTPSGALTTICSFTLSAGLTAEGGLIQGTDGNFYGTNTIDGANNLGTVFKITPDGTLTTLYNFGSMSSDGQYPNGTLAQGTDGNFYGATETGGPHGVGTVFRITPAGTMTTLYSFGGVPADGASPKGGLIEASDGNLYGTTLQGGAKGFGTIFRITPAGTLTTLHSFTGTSTDGGGPEAALIQATDGNFYGTNSTGVFKMTPAGTVTTIYSFGTSGVLNGSPIQSAIIQATDGNFYGTAVGGGANQDGFVFQVTPSGPAKVLYNFSGTEGRAPNGVIQASDGNLYGTAQGGASSDGIIFRLTLPVAAPAAPSMTPGGVVPVYSSSATIQSGEWVSIYGTNLASTTATWTGNFPNSLGGTSVTINGKSAYLWFVSPTQINLQSPNDTATGTVPVVVQTASGTATSTVTLAQFAPSFLLLDAKHVTGIILRSGGSGAYGGGSYDIIGPTGTSLGYPTVAAKAGDTVELFGVGFGPTSPAVPPGQVFSGAAATTNAVRLLINNVSVAPSFAGLTGAGLYQINLTVPSGLSAGDAPLMGTVGGVQTPAGVVISLQ
jgi:uncharacterized protein (TIGR03437 family)